MADERHGIEVGIDSTQAKAGENRVIRSLENIKRKVSEMGQAGVAAGTKAADGFKHYASSGKGVEKTLDAIKARSRQTANDNVRDAQKAGSAWSRAFSRIGGTGAGGGGGGFFRDLGKAAGGASTEMRGLSSNMSAASATGTLLGRSIGVVVGGLAALVSLRTAKAFLDITDASKRVEAQLRLTIPATMSYASAFKSIGDIAKTTRSPIEDTAILYGRIARTATEMGHSADSAARATETVAKSLKISGAGAIETASTVRQLTQALQSGVLRGDEFNSMMENSPRLAKLLADSMGVPVGALREMAEEGTITADKLYKALTDRKFTDQLDAEFREIPITFSDAMTLVHNAAFTTFSDFDRGGQFSNMIVNFVTGGSEGFQNMGTSAEEFGMRTRATIDGAVASISALIDRFSSAGESLGKVGDIVGWVGGELGKAFSGDQFAGLFKALDGIINTFVDIINKIRELNNMLPGTHEAAMLTKSDLAGGYQSAYDSRMRQLKADQGLREINNDLPSGVRLRRTASGFLMPEVTAAGTRVVNTNPMSRPNGSGSGGGRSSNYETRQSWSLGDVKKLISGAGGRVTSDVRSFSKQQSLFNEWLAGGSKGQRPATPGTSYHEKGQAVDITGMTIGQVRKAVQGLPIKELINEGDHVHLAWGKAGDAVSKMNQELEKQLKLAETRKENEGEFWAKLQDETKLASMLPGEAEKYAKQLEIQLIRADGQLVNIKELAELDKQRINSAIDLANKNKLVADMTGAGKEAQIEMVRLLDQQQILATGTKDQVEEQMELEGKMWPYKQRALELGLDLQDETVKKAFEELSAREKVNLEIARRNRLIEEGNNLVDQLLDAKDPFRAVDREYRENLKKISASTRPKAEKDAALDELARDYQRKMDEIQLDFRDKMLDNVRLIAGAFGGAFGEMLEAIGKMVILLDSTSQRLLESGQMRAESKLGKMFQGFQGLSNNLSTIFGGAESGTGKFFAGLSKVMGQAAYGAEIGSTVNSVLKGLGVKKFSNTGSQIGGAAGSVIGTAIGGPVGGMIGSFLGSLAGGLIGGLFKKTSKGSVVLTDATSTPSMYHDRGLGAEAMELGKAVQQGLTSVANQMGAQLGAFKVSIGMRDDKFVVDTAGTGATMSKYGAQKFDTAEEAIAFAILDAIKDGALKGLSEATNRILKGASTSNLDQLLQAAQIYEQLLKAAAQSANPISAAYSEFITNMKATLEMLKAAGYSYDDLMKLQGAFAEQQKQLLEEMTSGYRAFLKEITSGPSSGKTIFDQFTAAMSDFRSMVSKGGYTQDEFTGAGQNVIDLARQVYGSATPQFEKIRAELVAATQKAIDDASQAATDALNSAGIIASIGTTNSILTAMLNQMYAENGTTPPGTGAPTPGSAPGSGTTTPPSSYSYSGGYVGSGGSTSPGAYMAKMPGYE